MKIKGVILDYGGVLSIKPDDAKYGELAAKIGMSTAELKDAWRKYRRAYDADDISCEELYRRAFRDLGRKFPPETAAVVEREDSAVWNTPNPGTLEWMRQIKASGLALGILTNMNTPFANRYFRPRFREQIALADQVVISGEERVTKPDPAIYRVMERRIGLAPDELVFFDDLADNVDGALACGWRAVRFESAAQAAKALAALA